MINSDCGNMPEILAPAGSVEQLTAAVRAGADAVYLGAGFMNARRSAANFTTQELLAAAEYCHERGVKVYVVMNTLLFDDEFDQAAQLLETLCDMPADGIIIQDVGLAQCIKNSAPQMPLHASTQMSVHNRAALFTLERMGFCRVVLARETSGEELCVITKDAPIEIEAFVHGALCMSVSGQCYLSALLGSRSGNRGRCAQPCRLPFKAGSFDYCLSLKDMSFTEHIPSLAEMGVSSLKIEGRMKRPEYCAAAVSACRAARDNEEVPAQLKDKLAAVFSRSGFTDGYFTARRGKVMFGHRTRDDVAAADSATLASLHELYKNEFPRVPVDMTLAVKKGESVQLSVCDSDGHHASSFGDAPMIATGRPLDSEQAAAKLSKTGGTPYISGNIQCDIEDGLFLPVSALNSLRRDCLEKLSEQRRKAQSIPCITKECFDKKYEAHISAQKPELHAVFFSVGQIPQQLDTALKRVYIPLETAEDPEIFGGILQRLEKYNIQSAVEAPRGIFGKEEHIKQLLKKAYAAGVRGCMVHNIGLADMAVSEGFSVYGGFGLNITNTHSIKAYESLGLQGCELSFELTLERMSRMGGDIPRGLLVYGRLPLMLTRNCPAANGGCKGDNRRCFITDRMGIDFPVRCRMSCSEVLNSVPLYMLDRLRGDVAAVSAEHHIMRFTTESAEEAARLLAAYSAVSPGKPAAGTFTRGLYYRGVE